MQSWSRWDFRRGITMMRMTRKRMTAETTKRIRLPNLLRRLEHRRLRNDRHLDLRRARLEPVLERKRKR